MNFRAPTILWNLWNTTDKQVSLRHPRTELVKVDARAADPSAKWIKWHPQQFFSSFIIGAFSESPHNPVHPSPQGYQYWVICQQNIVTFYNITLKYESPHRTVLEVIDFEPLTQQTASPPAGEMPKVKCLLKIHIWLPGVSLSTVNHHVLTGGTIYK